MDDAANTIMERAGAAVAAGRRGERAEARAIFDELWDQVGSDDGDPVQRCAVAHWMADVQDDVQSELLWDLRALEAAQSVTDAHAAAAGMAGPAAALYPSLHLNLADVYLRLGDRTLSRHHLELGRATVGALPDDGYAEMIRGGLTRVEDALTDAP